MSSKSISQYLNKPESPSDEQYIQRKTNGSKLMEFGKTKAAATMNYSSSMFYKSSLEKPLINEARYNNRNNSQPSLGKINITDQLENPSVLLDSSKGEHLTKTLREPVQKPNNRRQNFSSAPTPYMLNNNDSQIQAPDIASLKHNFLRNKQSNQANITKEAANSSVGSLLSRSPWPDALNLNSTLKSSFYNEQQQQTSQFISPLRDLTGISVLDPGYVRSSKPNFLETLGVLNSDKWVEKYTRNIDALKLVTPRETFQQTIDILHNSSNFESLGQKTSINNSGGKPFKANLKMHNSQNIKLNGRKDVVELIQWVDEMLREISD